MAQFDVYKNPNPRTNSEVPYLLDVQHDILQSLNTRVVVPLIINMEPAKHLNPTFTIEKTHVVMSSAELAAILKSDLGEYVCSLKEYRTNIINSIDFLISGF
jgi:toxin CcdB